MMFVFEYFTVSYDIAGYDFMGTHLKVVSTTISLPRQEPQNMSAHDPALLLLFWGDNDQLSKLKTNEPFKFVQGWSHSLGRTPELCSDTSHSQTM